jgi:hypothetical protein
MQNELPSTFNCSPPSIIIDEPSEVNEKEASFHVVEINELNTPSTSTQESSFSHGSEKTFIHAPNRSSVKKKVRWENHRISEESITKLYPNQSTTSNRVGVFKNQRAPCCGRAMTSQKYIKYLFRSIPFQFVFPSSFPFLTPPLHFPLPSSSPPLHFLPMAWQELKNCRLRSAVDSEGDHFKNVSKSANFFYSGVLDYGQVNNETARFDIATLGM